MSEYAKNAIGYGIATIMIVFAIGCGIWVAGKTIGGIGNWWHSINKTSPEEQAQRDAAYKASAEAWAKDPTNPKVVAQKCLDNGGTPTFSAWDGRVTSCAGAEGKSVNIEVNQ